MLKIICKRFPNYISLSTIWWYTAKRIHGFSCERGVFVMPPHSYFFRVFFNYIMSVLLCFIKPILGNCWWYVCLFVCLLVVIKLENPYFASRPGLFLGFLVCYYATQLALISGTHICLFWCWYKTRKSLLRLRLWARSKTVHRLKGMSVCVLLCFTMVFGCIWFLFLCVLPPHS